MADRVNQLIKLKPFMITSLCKTLTLIAVLDNFPSPQSPANIGVDAPTAHYDASAEFMGIGVIFKTTPFYLTCSLFTILDPTKTCLATLQLDNDLLSRVEKRKGRVR